MKIYNYHPHTFVFTQETNAKTEPISNTFLVPMYSTMVPVPSLSSNNTIQRFDSANNEWEIIDNYYDEWAWDKITLKKEKILHYGALKSNLTTQKPYTTKDIWDSNTNSWVVDLNEFRNIKIDSLKSDCQSTIEETGFLCDALGYMCRYDSDIKNQINLTGSFNYLTSTGANGIVLTCCSLTDNIKKQRWHTASQAITVYYTGIGVMQAYLNHFDILREEVYSANTIIEINQKTWDSPF